MVQYTQRDIRQRVFQRRNFCSRPILLFYFYFWYCVSYYCPPPPCAPQLLQVQLLIDAVAVAVVVTVVHFGELLLLASMYLCRLHVAENPGKGLSQVLHGVLRVLALILRLAALPMEGATRGRRNWRRIVSLGD